jgi:hypothetical protein
MRVLATGTLVVWPLTIFEQGMERSFDIVGKAVNELFTMPWDGFQLSAELRVLLEA